MRAAYVLREVPSSDGRAQEQAAKEQAGRRASTHDGPFFVTKVPQTQAKLAGWVAGGLGQDQGARSGCVVRQDNARAQQALEAMVESPVLALLGQK